MTQVTDIIFGDPVTPEATAKEGTLEDLVITVSRANHNVSPEGALAGVDRRMKVQWSENGRPQKQVRRRVLGADRFIAVHLDEKEDAEAAPSSADETQG